MLRSNHSHCAKLLKSGDAHATLGELLQCDTLQIAGLELTFTTVIIYPFTASTMFCSIMHNLLQEHDHRDKHLPAPWHVSLQNYVARGIF